MRHAQASQRQSSKGRSFLHNKKGIAVLISPRGKSIYKGLHIIHNIHVPDLFLLFDTSSSDQNQELCFIIHL